MFSTPVLYLAAALVVSGYPIVRIDMSNPRSAKCMFEDSTELRKTVEDYYSGKLEVVAVRYFQEYKTITERISY